MDKVKINLAKDSLNQELENRYAVGISGDKITINYTTRKPPLELQEIQNEGWRGFDVELKHSGQIRKL